MKRRSARPFMVEVKHARTPRTASTAEPQARPDKVLWPELIQAETKLADPVFTAPPAPRPETKEPDAPVRRVLPSLVPMFQSADAPEAEPEMEAPQRRVRRGRPAAAVPPARTAPPVEPMPKTRAIAARPQPPVAIGPKAGAADPAEAAENPSPRPMTWRRTKELRLGERWKRRLPSYLR
ncbi:hypothetical protein SAMN05216360_1335 [Methylobacterium phyllostachyos]|uniref:Uncharacterized protein n=1 Tax=Methylobacterium phyllostachyos TaxID=582672 RepID=A0A1H0LB12_9HYPH|nr:hypothetical protein [Methylobacterium phyllostachyos]SDO65193.1 hypothetical protein SAMN05216360_1335 [Methylobacterium phyllostachyos]